MEGDSEAMESVSEAEARSALVPFATDGVFSRQFGSYGRSGRSGKLRHFSSQGLRPRHEYRSEKSNLEEHEWFTNRNQLKQTWKPMAASNSAFVGLVTVEDATHAARSQSRAEESQSQRGGKESALLSSRQGPQDDVACDTELKGTVEEFDKKKARGQRKCTESRIKQSEGASCDKPPIFAEVAEENLGNRSSGTTHLANNRPGQSNNNSGCRIDSCGVHPTAATTVEEVGSTPHPQPRQRQCSRKSVFGDEERHPPAVAITAEGLGNTSRPEARQVALEEGFGNTSHPEARRSLHTKKETPSSSTPSGDRDIPGDSQPTAKAAEEELDKTTIPQDGAHQSGNTSVSEDRYVPRDTATTEEELDKTTHRQFRIHDPTANEESDTAHFKAKNQHITKKEKPGDGDVPRDTHPRASAEEDFGDISQHLAKGPRHNKWVSGRGYVPFDTYPKATSAAGLGSSSKWSRGLPIQSGANAASVACGNISTALDKTLTAEAEEFHPQAKTIVGPNALAEGCQPLATDRTRNWPLPRKVCEANTAVGLKAVAEASEPLATDRTRNLIPHRKRYEDRLREAMETHLSSSLRLRDVIDSWDISQILVVRDGVSTLQKECEYLSKFLNYRAFKIAKLLRSRGSSYDEGCRHQEIPFSGTEDASEWMNRERCRLEEALAELETAEIAASARLQEVEAERDKALAEAREASARAKEAEAERDQALAEATAGRKAWETEKVKMRFEARTALNNAQAAAHRERTAAAKMRSSLEAKLKKEEDARQRNEDLFCKICFSTPRNVVLLPCFHGHCCSGCITNHRRENATCPVCRTLITGTVPYTA